MVFVVGVCFSGDGMLTALWGNEPAWRGVCEWTTSAQCHQAANRGTGTTGNPTVRHQQTAESFTWLCLQNPRQIQRDRFNPAWGYRREQTARDDAESRRVHSGPEAQRSGDLRLGNQRPAIGRRGLRQIQRPISQLHQQDTAKQAGRLWGEPSPSPGPLQCPYLPSILLQPEWREFPELEGKVAQTSSFRDGHPHKQPATTPQSPTVSPQLLLHVPMASTIAKTQNHFDSKTFSH